MAPRPHIIALGWDPGPTSCGYAIVSCDGPHRRPVLMLGGEVELTELGQPFASLASLAANAPLAAPPVVGIEIPAGLHPRPGADPANLFARSKQLHATARVAGMISRRAEELCLRRLELTATNVRRAFCGKGNADNARIKRACQMYVGCVGRCNAHVRDAIAIAVVTLWNPKAVQA